MNQTTKLDLYKEGLDELYKEYISPILNNKTVIIEGESQLVYREYLDRTIDKKFWDEGNPETPKERCSYDTYKKVSQSPTKRTIMRKAFHRGNSLESPNDKIKYSYKFIYNKEKDIYYNPHKKLIEGLNSIYPDKDFVSSNQMYCYKKYKKHNGYMGWHTNDNVPGDRWYFVYNTDDSSFMRFIDPNTKEMITYKEPKGWCLNHFVIGGTDNPLWHCIYTEAQRFSLGIKIKRHPHI